jgi:acyl-CoA dehydrogenase
MTIANEQLDALRNWLRSVASPFAEVRAATQLKGGQSNPTYRLDTSNGPVVLRKQPAGASKWTHDVRREHTVLKALAPTDVLTPTPYEFCDDQTIVGGDFYLMEFVDGRIIDDCRIPGVEREHRRAIYRSFAEEVARLHAIDPDTVGLSAFGEPREFVARQIKLHARLFKTYMPEGEPHMEWLEEVLPDHVPATGNYGIINNDIRLGNAVLHPTESRVISLLDWEMSTLGDTRADASLLLLPYHLPPGHPQGSFHGVDLAAEGLPDEAEIIAAYTDSGSTAAFEDIDFFTAFNLFRYASVSAGIDYRYRHGISVSHDAALYGPSVTPTAEAAVELAKRTFAKDRNARHKGGQPAS